MNHSEKRFMIVPVLLVLLFLLAGCAWQQTGQEEDTTLWVLTEKSNSDGMNLQAQMIAERMEEAYENLTVRLDVLPTDTQERELLLKRLRTEIMAGGGPDVYLLPTGNTVITDYGTEFSTHRETLELPIEPLFLDVNQAMRSGLFADVQEYYDADRDLGTEALRKEIMDAGTMGESRYVLPLRFTMPVILTDPALWDGFGLSEDALDSDAGTLVYAQLAQEHGAEASPGIRLPMDMSLLPRAFDYEKEKLLLTAQDIAAYLRLYQTWVAASTEPTQSLIQEWEEMSSTLDMEALGISDYQTFRQIFPFGIDDIDDFNRVGYYITLDMYWRTADLPLFVSCLADTLETVAISKHAGFPLAMYPLRTLDGSVTANITYFGAVGGGCENPELAYAFLRQFLTEEFQWDIYRPRITNRGTFTHDPEVQNDGQVENSWPVRMEGSVPYLWSSLKYQYIGHHSTARPESSLIMRQIQGVALTDADLPALSWPIDEVRFPVTLTGEETLESVLSLLNEETGTPTDVDIDALAETVQKSLWWHLAEG